MRLSTAIALGKATATLSRRLHRGGGTTMPGRVARAVEPRVLPLLSRRLRYGSVIVAGTNGKTTTARLLAHIMEALGRVPVHNRAGANLAAGIASALVEHADLFGRPSGDVGIFEVDEATVPRVVPHLAPRVMIFTNLFRDQLDRYGEIDHIAGLWRATGEGLRADAVVVANGDDPLVYDAVRGLPGRLVTFGIEDERHALPAIEHTAEARYCYRCGIPYAYTWTYFGHMGRYRCPTCGTGRPPIDLAARDVVLAGADGASFTLAASGGGRTARITTVLPGLYNVYNVLAASAAALEMGAPLDRVAEALASFAPAFGRAERVVVGGAELRMLLSKNPAGFNEVLRTVLSGGPLPAVLIAINDNIADGRDVSWLWDVEFEMLAGRVAHVVVTGLRAEDMALRLRYAGLAEGAIEVQREYEPALRAALARAAGRPLFVLPTYTAMLALREVLQRWGAVGRFWEH
ncbi:MAG TPA: MurT ligase domain-containing protein [bacterium]|nr:MurT ligase domain-containing protein [bacterium]